MHGTGRLTPTLGRLGVLVPARGVAADHRGRACVCATWPHEDPIDHELGQPQSAGHEHRHKPDEDRDRAKVRNYLAHEWHGETSSLGWRTAGKRHISPMTGAESVEYNADGRCRRRETWTCRWAHQGTWYLCSKHPLRSESLEIASRPNKSRKPLLRMIPHPKKPCSRT